MSITMCSRYYSILIDVEMRTYIITSLLLIFQLPAAAQTVISSESEPATVYKGYSNLLTIMDREYPCNSLLVITDNGNVERQNECAFTWSPILTGSGTISVYGIKGKDTIMLAAKKFLVKELEFHLSLPCADSGRVMLEHLLDCHGPVIQGPNNWVKPRVLSYNVIGLRGDTILFNIKNLEQKFTTETLEQFKTLKAGDSILFFNIRGIGVAISREPAYYIIFE